MTQDEPLMNQLVRKTVPRLANDLKQRMGAKAPDVIDVAVTMSFTSEPEPRPQLAMEAVLARKGSTRRLKGKPGIGGKWDEMAEKAYAELVKVCLDA